MPFDGSVNSPQVPFDAFLDNLGTCSGHHSTLLLSAYRPAMSKPFAVGKGRVEWWAHPDSNQGPAGYEPAALPLSYGPKINFRFQIADFRLKNARILQRIIPINRAFGQRP